MAASSGREQLCYTNALNGTRRTSHLKREIADTPHLTLARVKSGRKISGDLLKFVEKNRNMRFGESAFRRLSLFSSKLTPDGPVYTELKAIHL